MFQKLILILFLLLQGSFMLHSQDIKEDVLIVTKKNESFKNDKVNAIAIVNKLTNEGTNDKEKFDAIFKWVAQNISYSNSSFYLPLNSGPDQITKILETRKTICLGYAQLMDTLCNLAGIINTTVYGYAKDEFFDVGDTIVTHNHAWNAVKLDGLWYVYDVTWTNGVSEYKLTRAAKFILKLLDKFPPKYKKVKIKVPRKYRKSNFCGKIIEPEYYFKRRFFNFLIRRRLSTLPIKVEKKYFKGINKNFYLSEPNLFAATHVPDDGMWSLLGKTKINEFENDSLFYNLHDSMYKYQVRKGVECLACDDYIILSKQHQLQEFNKNCTQFNRNNKFINTYCNEELGRSLFYKSLLSTESRIEKIDSTALFHHQALSSINESRIKFVQFIKYHKTKNDTKAKLLLKDNAGHIKFVKSKVKQTLVCENKLSILNSLTGAYFFFTMASYKRYVGFRTDFDYSKFKLYSAPKILELQIIHTKKETQLDSIITVIEAKKNSYDSIIVNLALNIWPYVFSHDSIIKPFQKSIYYRQLYNDNYKKVIVDERKKIYQMEYKYIFDIEHLLYKPINEAVLLRNQITNLLKWKQTLCADILKLDLELYKTKEISVNELNQFKAFAIKETKQDACWLVNNFAKESKVHKGLLAVRRKQKNMILLIEFENYIERNRKSGISSAIKNGYKQGNFLLANDTKKLKNKCKEIDKYSKEVKDTATYKTTRYDKLIIRINKLMKKE